MTSSKRHALLVAVLLLSFAGGVAAKGLGFSIEGKTSGFFLNPVMDRVTISKVEPGSVAADSGMLAGDVVLELNGTHVPGMRAHALMTFWKSIPNGTPLRFRLQRRQAIVNVVLPTDGLE